MSSAQENADDYEDRRKHLARHPYEILAAWVVASALAAAVFLGLSPSGHGPLPMAPNADAAEGAPGEAPFIPEARE
jgi:hypothetical protein